MPNRFWVNRLITAMIFLAWEEPNTRFFPQPPPVFPEFLEQFLTQHHVPIFASLSAPDVNHHALAIDVGNFQVCQFGVPGAGGVERHQHRVVERRARGVNKPFHFFLTENRW
jgi:hypothetical protein